MPDGSEESRRGGKRRRVTLSLRRAPLALPGESQEGREDERLEPLDIPSGPREGVAEAAAAPPLPAAEDGWTRTAPAAEGLDAAPKLTLPAGDDGHDALTLVHKRSRRSSPGLDYVAEMRDRYALGDYTTALELAELILGRSPENEDAAEIAEGCRERLSQLYGSRLGDLDRVVRVAVQPSEVRWLGLDNRAAFLLSRIDGHMTLRELLQVAGLSRLDALKTLTELLELRAIRLL